MFTIELIFLLIFIGAATGATFASIHVSPALIAVPTIGFFLPVFGLSFSQYMLPIVATCITAFIPTHLYSWVQAMKRQDVDSQSLIYLAPGMAMGAVIGAQLLSIINLLTFKITFSLIALIAVINVVYELRQRQTPILFMNILGRLPTGLFIGVLSLLSGNGGGVLARSLLKQKNITSKNQQGTIDGLVVFASIAGMVGFIYPAQALNSIGESGFAGAIHLPSLLVLACSHGFFYWLCRHQSNRLDKNVLLISFIIFIVCSAIRIWLL
ncbi:MULTISPECIES: sulfite exporter TauE/SafE family protein [Marinomonas]|uniref:Probable membrane transporter protein n=1 Tax=Marinomonas rhodophyticola TaxID=2992803 RepID=A0ABT3KMP4_9GAMM|nr:sulfite exporter TauE/SafE family protein [Marinomonas sp. KJ51-3]MCW4631827.1 sulfite exporter TauE/SafE family protein [Marinomonas sp. KJ51-3]MCW4631842.1 sulfite exporter TauE/SafE family protein [Marinomonas sp. KJ51-3]